MLAVIYLLLYKNSPDWHPGQLCIGRVCKQIYAGKKSEILILCFFCLLGSSPFGSNQSATVPSPPVILSLFFLLFCFSSLVFIPFPLCVLYVCVCTEQLGSPSAPTFYTWLIGTPAFHHSSSHHKKASHDQLCQIVQSASVVNSRLI